MKGIGDGSKIMMEGRTILISILSPNSPRHVTLPISCMVLSPVVDKVEGEDGEDCTEAEDSLFG